MTGEADKAVVERRIHEPEDQVYKEQRDQTAEKQVIESPQRDTGTRPREPPTGDERGGQKRTRDSDDGQNEQRDRGAKEQVTELRRSSRTLNLGNPFTAPFWTRGAKTAKSGYKTTSVQSSGPAGRTGASPVPAYMAAGAHTAAVAPADRPKRAREDDHDIVEGQNKQVKTSSSTLGSINAMTEKMQSLTMTLPVTLDRRADEEAGLTPYRERPRQDMRDRDIPYNMIRLEEGARMPSKEFPHSAGYDVFAFKEVRVPRGETVAVPLGFQMAPACGQAARLAETSSWPFQKPDLVLRAGVLDPDYRGQVAAIFTNIGNQDYVYVDKGERVAQVIFSCFRCAPWQPIARLPKSVRGTYAGFQRWGGGERISSSRGGRGQGDGGVERRHPDESDWVRAPVGEVEPPSQLDSGCVDGGSFGESAGDQDTARSPDHQTSHALVDDNQNINA